MEGAEISRMGWIFFPSFQNDRASSKHSNIRASILTDMDNGQRTPRSDEQKRDPEEDTLETATGSDDEIIAHQLGMSVSSWRIWDDLTRNNPRWETYNEGLQVLGLLVC
jgi:hypothetical protein